MDNEGAVATAGSVFDNGRKASLGKHIDKSLTLGSVGVMLIEKSLSYFGRI